MSLDFKLVQSVITDVILEQSPCMDNPGLLHGKMGISIYLFHLYKKTGKTLYRDHAELLIDTIWEKAEDNVLPLDFESGLAGVAWGIKYLVKNRFIEAETDDILYELDDKVFKFLADRKELPIDLHEGLLGYGFYLLSRLQDKEFENMTNRDFMLKRLAIDHINQIYDTMERKNDLFKEPVGFKIDWPLPLLFVLLVEFRKLRFYDRKIDITLERLSKIAFSIFPLNTSNRLYLSIVMMMIAKEMDCAQWEQHAVLLQNHINEGQLLSEFPGKSIWVSNGLGGIILYLKQAGKTNKKSKMVSCKAGQRILQSSLWQGISSEGKFHPKRLGLYEGIAGVGYSMLGLADP